MKLILNGLEIELTPAEYKEMVDLGLIEKGKLANWEKLWDQAGSPGIPRNPCIPDKPLPVMVYGVQMLYGCGDIPPGQQPYPYLTSRSGERVSQEEFVKQYGLSSFNVDRLPGLVGDSTEKKEEDSGETREDSGETREDSGKEDNK